MWGPDKDWQCFRCYSTYPPSEMSLHRPTKKWYCSACIHPTVINTPYILTPKQVESITLRCSSCNSVFITRFKSKLEGDKSTFICQRCRLASVWSLKEDCSITGHDVFLLWYGLSSIEAFLWPGTGHNTACIILFFVNQVHGSGLWTLLPDTRCTNRHCLVLPWKFLRPVLFRHGVTLPQSVWKENT